MRAERLLLDEGKAAADDPKGAEGGASRAGATGPGQTGFLSSPGQAEGFSFESVSRGGTCRCCSRR